MKSGRQKRYVHRYDEVAPRLYRFALLLIGEELEASQAVERAFFQGAFLADTPRESFLVGMYRLTYEEARKGARRLEAQFPEFEGEEIIRSDQHRFFLALDRLAFEDRAAVLLCLLEGLSAEAAGAVIGEAAFRVGLRLERSRNCLANHVPALRCRSI